MDDHRGRSPNVVFPVILRFTKLRPGTAVDLHVDVVVKRMIKTNKRTYSRSKSNLPDARTEKYR